MKYLFFDIDGTLVSHNSGLIPSAKKAIEETRRQGNKCFLCTGRHLASLSSIKELEMDGVIYCNGGGIYMDGKVIRTDPIPHAVCSRTVYEAEKREGTYSLMSSWISLMNDAMIDHIRKSVFYDPRYKTFEEKMEAFGAAPFTSYRNQEILKIDIGFANEEIMDDFLKVMDPQLKLASTAGYNIAEGKRSGEITRKDVNKGTGIQKLIAMLGADMKDTYGFGDSSNDLEMIEMCNTGIAMGNAFDEVKEKAGFITKNIDEDGIEYAMKHFNLI